MSRSTVAADAPTSWAMARIEAGDAGPPADPDDDPRVQLLWVLAARKFCQKFTPFVASTEQQYPGDVDLVMAERGLKEFALRAYETGKHADAE